MTGKHGKWGCWLAEYRKLYECEYCERTVCADHGRPTLGSYAVCRDCDKAING